MINKQGCYIDSQRQRGVQRWVFVNTVVGYRIPGYHHILKKDSASEKLVTDICK
jgi:uncharacterized protein YdbL (DUF1318 family)